MSTTQTTTGPKGSQAALVIGIIGVILGAAALGYSVYLGQTQVPSQISSLPQINQRPESNRTILLDWVSSYDSGLDRFAPPFITIAQGDTVFLTFVSNDTDDGHTFTMSCTFSRGCPANGQFRMNASITGQINAVTEFVFTGTARSCLDQNGAAVPNCDSQSSVRTFGTKGNLTATGVFTAVNPGIYKFVCEYHQQFGMFGFLVVLPNKGFTG